MLETGGVFKVFIRVTRRTGRMLAKANAFTQIFYSLRGRRLKGKGKGVLGARDWAQGADYSVLLWRLCSQVLYPVS